MKLQTGTIDQMIIVTLFPSFLQVVSLMSQGISSIMEDTFTSQDNLDGREKGRSRRQPLLASSCHSCAIVAQLAPSIQRQSSCLGSYLSLLMEVRLLLHYYSSFCSITNTSSTAASCIV